MIPMHKNQNKSPDWYKLHLECCSALFELLNLVLVLNGSIAFSLFAQDYCPPAIGKNKLHLQDLRH